MAKYRKRYRRFRKSGRWSSNMGVVDQAINIPVGEFFASIDLAANPQQTTSTVSQQYTVKNVEFSYKFELNNIDENRDVEMLQMYIMYIPQGFDITLNTVTQHPEWIMNYQFIGNPDSDGIQRYQPRKIKTRLARKLQTGDSIKLLVMGNNKSNSTIGGNCSGVIRWWTKAN